MAVKNKTARILQALYKKQKRRKQKQASLQFEKLEPRQVLNAVPLVNNDLGYQTDLDTALTISLTAEGVLNNDFDAEGSTLTATKVNDPANGTLTFSSNGTFTYTPNTSYEGVDTFTYEVSDGTNTSVEATVQITVGEGLSGALNGEENSSNLLHDGALALGQSLGAGLELSYRSDTIPVVLVPIETFITDATTVPDSITAELVIDGVSSGSVLVADTGLATGEPIRFALRSLPTTSSTGMYDWTITATLEYASSPDITSTFTGSQAIVNRTASEFGAGWWLNGLDQIYDSTEGALLVNGDGTTLWFEKDGSDYLAADGDLSLSTLVKNTGGDFTLTDKWGDARNFDSNGYITDVQLLNNTNASFTFDYDVNNRIEKITDEFGREATFTFDGNGKLTSVNDFFSRDNDVTITSGNLIDVTVADETATGYTAPTWSFDYVSIGGYDFLDEATDPANNTTEYIYDT